MNRRGALLTLALSACGDDVSETPADDAGTDPRGDGGDGDGDGDRDAGADPDIDYPNFTPRNCAGTECPHGECGRASSPKPSCAEDYEAPFDAAYPDYCLAARDASYCVGSSTIGAGSPPGETYCINCSDGKPTFEHCHDEGTLIFDGTASCMNPF